MPKPLQQVNLLAELFPEEARAPVPSSTHNCTPALTIRHKGEVTPMPRLDLPDIGDNEVVLLWRWFGDTEGEGEWGYTGTMGFYHSVRQVMRPQTDIALPCNLTPDQLCPEKLNPKNQKLLMH